MIATIVALARLGRAVPQAAWTMRKPNCLLLVSIRLRGAPRSYFFSHPSGTRANSEKPYSQLFLAGVPGTIVFAGNILRRVGHFPESIVFTFVSHHLSAPQLQCIFDISIHDPRNIMDYNVI